MIIQSDPDLPGKPLSAEHPGGGKSGSVCISESCIIIQDAGTSKSKEDVAYDTMTSAYLEVSLQSLETTLSEYWPHHIMIPFK